jgi:hypothetical protein
MQLIYQKKMLCNDDVKMRQMVLIRFCANGEINVDFFFTLNENTIFSTLYQRSQSQKINIMLIRL